MGAQAESMPSDQEQQQLVANTPWLSDRLTEAEIEALRQDQSDALDSLQKAYPNLRIHQAGEARPEEPKQ